MGGGLAVSGVDSVGAWAPVVGFMGSSLWRRMGGIVVVESWIEDGVLRVLENEELIVLEFKYDIYGRCIRWWMLLPWGRLGRVAWL